MDHILSGARHCISDDANVLLIAPYTKKEILEALSGMGPMKASGNDGFPIIFFQRCWEIIDDAKMVANRFQKVLKDCIDEAQSAFMPERLISDNVLLAYEILHSFHQKMVWKKGFMALKLDMSKAYDQ
ncbi:reverse transcriptase [Gossypium australe]|uniref:Reverse transcriptase n=1 Tax=Gossypium australe TaxID=47621 RepID=A0A5B6X2S9_9ROSI|nr:reverse transcriptase [Gossypium australe]